MRDITIKEFIETIFDLDTLPDDERVCLSIRTESGQWDNFPVTERRLKNFKPGTGAWYFGVCTYQGPDENGWFPRDRDHAMTALCLVLDDIGTKIDPKRIKVEPTWKIETSPGNFQYGYLIQPWGVTTEDGEQYYEGVQRGLAEAELTDAGALGTYRIMRVPGSLHKSGFVARITEWRPERVWDLEQLVDDFGVEPVLATKRTRRDPASVSAPVDLDDIDDPVLDWLVQEGHTTGQVGRKFIEVICPWASEHTSGGDTAGFTPRGYDDPLYDHAFNCLHEHCSRRKKRDFLAWVRDQGGPDLFPEWGGWPVLSRVDLPDALIGGRQNPTPHLKQLSTTANIRWVIQQMGITPRLNVMTHDVELHHDAYEGDTELQIRDALLRLGISHDRHMDDTLLSLAKETPYHPAEDWLLSLPAWDGETPWIDKLRDTVISPSEAWNGFYLRRWLIQAVEAWRGWRREEVRNVGHTLVFSGEQGIGKSRWFKSLLPSRLYLGEASIHLNAVTAKDDQINLLRRAMAEVSELDSIFSKTEIGTMKAYLSRELDTIRLPYARRATDRLRNTVHCASVNHIEFLNDPTGSRRFWPLEATAIFMPDPVVVRGAWSEALAAWEAGESWYLNEDEERQRKIEADEYRVSSHVEELFYDYFTPEWITQHPKDSLQPKTAREVAQLIKLDMREFDSPKWRAELVYLVGKYFGKSKKISGKQKARWVPVKPLGVVDGIGNVVPVLGSQKREKALEVEKTEENGDEKV